MIRTVTAWGAAALILTVFLPPAVAQLELAKLLASDGASMDEYGHSVALSGDLVLVGARGDDDSTGSAYVYRWNGVGWVEEQKLSASDGSPVDEYGHSVALEGDVAVVGSPQDADAGAFSGSAYVHRRIGSTWVEEQKLTASDGEPFDLFGIAVDLSGDVIVVGAYDADGLEQDTGAAYVFRWNGSAWVEEQKLIASDGEFFDFYGWAVAVSGDEIVVGAYQKKVGGASYAGAAYVYRWDGESWGDEQILTASDGTVGDGFGLSVDLQGDILVVGAPEDDLAGMWDGSAYVFRRDGDAWVEETKLIDPEATQFESFGVSVAVDGDRVAAGAYGADGGLGAAFVHCWDGRAWIQEYRLTADDAISLGIDVAIEGDITLLGAKIDDDLGWLSGSAYLFALNWNDLGQSLAGSLGEPGLIAAGSLQAGEAVALVLSGAQPDAAAGLVLGLSLAEWPFKGGVLVPSPDAIVPLVASPQGTAVLAGRWPPDVPADTIFAAQAWVVDGTGPFGFTASRAVSGMSE